MKVTQNGIYVTLTTYGVRLKSVHKTIASILKQSTLPEKIILWLDEKEFSVKDLPVELSVLLDDKFEVHFCENLRSYTKLVPSLRSFPDKTLITIDDDFVYPNDLLKNLINASQQFPKAVVCARGRVIKYTDGDFLSYPDWPLVQKNSNIFANYCILPLGYAGVLYPPGCLDSKVTDSGLFMSVAPHADDLWFKMMGLLANTPVVVLPLSNSMSMATIDGTQDNALYLTHNAGDANTEQMRAILRQYKELRVIFESAGYWSAQDNFMSLRGDGDFQQVGKLAVSIVNEIRESAINLESKNLFLSHKLMQLAKKIRPDGSLINKKLAEYESKINR